MDRLKQVFNILQHSNFSSLIEWHKIYPSNNVPIESQKVFLNWLNTNNLNILQDNISGILYFENKENKQVLKIEDFKNTFPDWYTYNEPFKRDLHIISKTCIKLDPDCLSGWLSPTGKFFECEWGEHESYAGKIVRKKDLVDKYKTYLEIFLLTSLLKLFSLFLKYLRLLKILSFVIPPIIYIHSLLLVNNYCQ